MRVVSVGFTLAVLILSLSVLAQDQPSQAPTGFTNAPANRGQAAPVPNAPLLLLDDKPLLLDDAPGLTNAFTLLADNSRCHVCHVNYAMEQIAVQHARTNIGCATCHGPSDAHIADESWASGGNGTAPDILILKEKINPSCWTCHELRKLSHKDHREFLWGVLKQQYCTDCHGQHRLPQRKCKWK